MELIELMKIYRQKDERFIIVSDVYPTRSTEIADVVLLSHGAVAANAIRQWISKLRSIRDLLEDKIKQDFVADLESWKNKFS